MSICDVSTNLREKLSLGDATHFYGPHATCTSKWLTSNGSGNCSSWLRTEKKHLKTEHEKTDKSWSYVETIDEIGLGGIIRQICIYLYSKS